MDTYGLLAVWSGYLFVMMSGDLYDWFDDSFLFHSGEIYFSPLLDLKKELDGSCVSGNRNGMEKIKCDTEAVDSSIKSIFSERGDLDFAEQLWCKMKCVSSYQELIACFTLVLESLECGEIQPWIHHGSGSLLSKLIQQSYHGKMEAVSLTGITPVQMLLEIGLDKMKKDYVNFFIDLKKELDGSCVSGNRNGMEKIKCDTEAVDSSIKSIFSERGDLDFAEQLWCKMKCVSSYQELIACFTLVLESLECGEIQPWIHHGSGSLLSKLIQQSYHGKMEAVSLTGITPVQMLLEIGLDKMKKDYVNFFIVLKRCFPGFSTKNGVLTVANQTTFNDGRGKTRNITDLREAAE
ncbi:uncharacterized protein AAGF69_011677 isoform 2-T11 [Amazona ochrocephala]